MNRYTHILPILAVTFVIASIVVSCKNKLESADRLDLSKTPIQRIGNVFAVQTENGNIKMRLEAGLMEHYEEADSSYDCFPEGISVYGYSEDGLLETVIVADNARHLLPKKSAANKDEIWAAYGNVILHNIIKQETMETDTIYWDRSSSEIYTDCYVKMYSPQGFMQGYGMRSDEMVRNSILYNPFNSYGITVRNTSVIIIDSVNYIGPFPKKIIKFAPLTEKL